MEKRIAILVLSACCVLPLLAQSADAIQKRLDTEAVKLQAWAADKVLLRAISDQNQQKLTQAEIQRRDKAWAGGTEAALEKAVTTGACADRLRELAATARAYGEVLLMDNQGALVCATNRTSDYWQGDEPKWEKSFAGGKGALFIDRPRLDESAGERLAQISLPVMEGGKAIGSMTVGVRIAALN